MDRRRLVFHVCRFGIVAVAAMAAAGKVLHSPNHHEDHVNILYTANHDLAGLVVSFEMLVAVAVLFAPYRNISILLSYAYGIVIAAVQLFMLSLPVSTPCGCLGAVSSDRAFETSVAFALLFSVVGYTGLHAQYSGAGKAASKS